MNRPVRCVDCGTIIIVGRKPKPAMKKHLKKCEDLQRFKDFTF